MVTGANSGIGRATVLELAGSGYDVLGTVRSAAKAEAVTAAADERGLQVRTVEVDVDDADSCAEGFAEIARLTDGGPWAVVNNAGYVQSGAVEDVSDEQVRAQLETNVVAPIRIARLVLPRMKERGEGRIVNISSVAGRTSTPLMGWYCASKHALEAVTDALRIEVEPDGVRVVLVEPGMFGTDIWSSTQDGGFPEPSSARYAAAYARAEAVSGQSDKLPDPVPLARYVVGADAVGGILAETLLPTTVTDFVKAASSGLRASPLRLPFLP